LSKPVIKEDSMNKTRYAEKQRKPEVASQSQSLFENTKPSQNESDVGSKHHFESVNVFPTAHTNNQATLQADFGISNQRAESYGFDFQPSNGGEGIHQNALAKMQNSFGQDFSSVKIHQDGQAEKLGAHAFTVGEDIYFSGSTYKPEDPSGQQLLGHELTHVVQQRENRVHAPDTGGAATVYQDPALEQEADQFGTDAAAGIKVPTSTTNLANATQSAIQQKPVVQPLIPAGIAALGTSIMTWAGTEATATAIGTLATIGGAAASAGSAIGSAIAPGQTGVQEVQIQPWMSDADKHKLEFIIQAKLVNAYVDAWVRAHPDVDLSAPDVPETASTTTTTSTTTPNPSPIPATPTPATPGSPAPSAGSTTTTTAVTTRDGSATASGGGVDTAIANAVKAQVQMEVEMAFNAHQRSAPDQEFIWSDSGDSTADMIGTVGAIKFSQVMGSFLTEGITLNANAQKIRNLALPMQGQTLTVKLFRGGRMHRGPSMSIGYGDSLAINLIGGGPTLNQAEPSMTYATSWNWDGNSTSMNIKMTIGNTGTVSLTETRDGTPDDSSWF
jgi:Domain of unknown function (DUF4157)